MLVFNFPGRVEHRIQTRVFGGALWKVLNIGEKKNKKIYRGKKIAALKHIINHNPNREVNISKKIMGKIKSKKV